MTKAVLDLGTNTFHLLIGKHENNQLVILNEKRIAVRIGEKGMLAGIITDEALERAIYCLEDFRKIIDSYKEIEQVQVFATSAFRNATNSEFICKTILEKTGFNVQIISGEDEAQLIFDGVKLSGALQDETALIVDIGGGSVEFIICNNASMLWKQSFDIGGLRLMERFHKTDPITDTELKAIDNHLNDELKELTKSIDVYKPKILLGSSGAFDTYVDIHFAKQKTEPSNQNYTTLPIESFFDIYNELITKNRIERLAIPGMIQLRVEMIVVASCITKFLIENYELKSIITSKFSLKEGAFTQ